MPESSDVLLHALRLAPRRYRMPPLPPSAQAAVALCPDTALAFALEGARSATARGVAPPTALEPVFTGALAALVREALEPQRGDPAFQALVLRRQHATVQEHVQLSARLAAHRRALRSAVDAVAHPGKLRDLPSPALREALHSLHALAAAEDWPGLRGALEQLLARELDRALHTALADVLRQPALEALLRHEALLGLEAVQRYRALCALRGPGAGSEAAATQGRASARAGADAERRAGEAFATIAGMLDERAVAGCAWRAVRGLRTPAGFPGDGAKAKDEWDAAIVCSRPGAAAAAAAARIMLLAEVKAAPAAATPDFSRLLRGLQRLGHANPHAVYAFPSDGGEIRVAGASLRELQPRSLELPHHVIYACSAPPEPQVQVLSAATRGVLLAEPASVAYAQALLAGEVPQPAALAPVWRALPAAAHLRSALHQFQTARCAREAMLHPDDLLLAVREVLG